MFDIKDLKYQRTLQGEVLKAQNQEEKISHETQRETFKTDKTDEITRLSPVKNNRFRTPTEKAK